MVRKDTALFTVRQSDFLVFSATGREIDILPVAISGVSYLFDQIKARVLRLPSENGLLFGVLSSVGVMLFRAGIDFFQTFTAILPFICFYHYSA